MCTSFDYCKSNYQKYSDFESSIVVFINIKAGDIIIKLKNSSCQQPQ